LLNQRQIGFKCSSSCAVLLYGAVKNGLVIRYKETYVSFLAPEAMQLMKEYLEERIRAREVLTPESYLFGLDRISYAPKKYLTSDLVSRIVMVASKSAGFIVTNEKTDQVQAKFTAHSLRRLSTRRCKE
jgi:integrase